MSTIDISKHIEHIEGICKDKNLKVIIFTFCYESANYKCFYSLGGQTITVAPEGYDIAMNIFIKESQLDNYLEDEVYQKLKEIHKGQLKTKVFCNNMLDTIMNLSVDMILKTNMDFYKICRTRSNDSNEDDRIYFYCWSRSHSGRKPTKKNLEKTRLFFGKEIYLICKINNISSRWKNKPTKKYLDL